MKVYGQLEAAQIENLIADPTGVGLVPGRAWYRTDTKTFKLYDGTVVQEYITLDQLLNASLTLLNKTLTSPVLQTPEVSGAEIRSLEPSTPANPVAGKQKLYFKADGKLYKLNSSGVETEIGIVPTSSKPYTNLVPNGDGESNLTGWESYIMSSNSTISHRGAVPNTLSLGTQPTSTFTRVSSSAMGGTGFFRYSLIPSAAAQTNQASVVGIKLTNPSTIGNTSEGFVIKFKMKIDTVVNFQQTFCCSLWDKTNNRMLRNFFPVTNGGFVGVTNVNGNAWNQVISRNLSTSLGAPLLMSEYVFYVDGVPPKKDSVDYNNLYLVFMDTASGSIGSGNLASQIDVDIDDIEVYCVSQFKGDLQRSQGVVIASQGFSGSSLSGAYGIASPAQIPNFSVLSLAMDTDATLDPGLYEMFAYFSASGVGSLGAGSPQFYKSGQILLACSDTKFLSNGVNTALASNENSQWVDLPLDYNNIPSTAGHTGSGVNQLANSAFTAVDVYMGNIVSLGSQGAQMTYKRIVFKVLRRTAVFPQLYDLRGRVQSNTGYSLTSYIRRIG